MFAAGSTKDSKNSGGLGFVELSTCSSRFIRVSVVVYDWLIEFRVPYYLVYSKEVAGTGNCFVAVGYGFGVAADTVMSDSKDSMVTYTAVSSPFEGLLDIRSQGVDEPPMMPEDPYAYVLAAFQAPPSPDYVSGPEYPPSPDFVLEPVYPEIMPPEDESDPEEDSEEDDDEDHKEDPADYPADGGDDGDDEDESSDDDEDNDVDIEGDEEEEGCQTSCYTYSTTITTSLWLSPLPQIPSPPLPSILSPLPVSSPPPASPTYPLGYRAAMIRLRAEAPSTSHSPPPHIILSHTRADTPPSGTPSLLPIPLPTSSPSLLLPSTDYGADRPEVCLPPQKRLCFAFGPRYEVEESSSAAPARPTGGFRADYGFVATMDREIRDRRAHARIALLMEREARMSREAWGRSMDASYLVRSEVMSLRTMVLGQQAVLTELQAVDRRRQGDYRVAGSRPQETGTVHCRTKAAKETLDPDDRV
ncbi:hypothetical protein Tco_1124904 [Tanacetum coccineum]|uniref:Uncharacterized protein n=1 Tax=Tanacetum coccineum TaxID=301880 RepID=A0ABQ5JBI3_9ASTR